MESAEILGYLLHHVPSVLARQLDQVLQEQLGVGLAQYRLLDSLQTTSYRAQRQLAAHLGQTEASISRQAKLLQAKGLLMVRINPQSKREHAMLLTDKGARIAAVARDAVTRYHEPLLAGLTEKQRHQLAEMLELLHTWSCQPGKLIACDHFPSGALAD